MHAAAVLVMVAALVAPAEQAAPARAFQFDETVAVTRGARLTVETFAGEVAIRTWDRDAVRVQARHPPRAKISVRTTPGGVMVESEHEARGSVDYEISAPAWMPLKVSGTYAFITIEGAQSEVSAETTSGDVSIKGGSGTVTAKSIMGEVIVEGATGRVTASSVNEGVSLSDVSGDVTAESNNGHIRLVGMKAQNAEASTINGHIVFEGVPAARGRYRFTTHNGNITIGVAESSNLTLAVRTYQGRFAPAFTLAGPPQSEVRRGRRTVYTLGSGSADMEVESFGGSIRVVPPGSVQQDEKGKKGAKRDKGDEQR